MPRAISNTLLADLLKQSTDEGLVPLLTVDWDDGPNSGQMRLVIHDQDVTLDGQTHTAADFGIELPDEDDSDIPMLRLSVQDPDLAVRTELRKLDSRYPATARLDFALLSKSPTFVAADIEMTFEGTLRSMRLGMVMLVASVEIFGDLSREPVTPIKMSPAYGFNALRGQ
jgi:hypothetical protein